MKKRKMRIGIASILLIASIVTTGCSGKTNNGFVQTVNESKTNNQNVSAEGLTAETTNEEVAQEVTEEVDESSMLPADFCGISRYSQFSQEEKDAIDSLKESLKSPIHEESQELIEKSGKTLYEFPKSYCTVDGVTPDYMLTAARFLGWNEVKHISENEDSNSAKNSNDLPVSICTRFDDDNLRYFLMYTTSEEKDFNLTLIMPGYRTELYDLELVDPSGKLRISDMHFVEDEDTIGIAGVYGFSVTYATGDYDKEEVIGLELKITQKEF